MKTSYETITGNESFDFNKLKTVAKELNESGLTKKINMVGCKKEEAVKRFLDAIEKIPDEDVQKMPDAVYELNNVYIDILDKNDGEEEKEEVGEEEEKVEKKEEKKKKKGISKFDPSKSNKAQIYIAWKNGEKDTKKLHKLVNEAVKITTIKMWLGMWKNGKGLPAVAKIVK